MFSALLLVGCLLRPALADRPLLQLEQMVPGLSIMTSFAHDAGDLLSRVDYEGKSYSPSEATQQILPRLNWPSRPDRLALGEAWVKVFAFHGCEVQSEPAPLAEMLPNGNFRYTAWAVVMTGREPGTFRVHRQAELTPEAALKVVDLQPKQTRLPGRP
jgi:hypothetical protein